MTARQRLQHTPFFDTWRERLRTATEPRGAKTDLATYMARQYDTPIHRWQVDIARILRGEIVINAEHVIAITKWMDLQMAPKPLPRSTDGVKKRGKT